METKKGKVFLFILLALVAILVTMIFRPFIVVLAISMALAVGLYPIFKWVRRRMVRGVSWAAAAITVLIYLIVLAVPLYFIGAKVVSEAGSLYNSITNGGVGQQFIDNIVAWINVNFPGSTGLAIKEKIAGSATFLTSTFGTIFSSTLNTVFSFLLILLSLFYFLKDGEHFRSYIIDLSPLADRNDDRILTKLANAVNGVIRGYIFIALIQGVLLGLGLYIFGVPNPVLWGVLAGIASMVPSIGTALVALPAILYLAILGTPVHAIGLTIWSLALVGTIDNLLQPIIVGKSIDLPPIAVLFSVLGGVTLFGVAGLIVGPLSLSLFLTLVSIYREEYSTN
jgi:predicted PurR-regulated permease PerM